MKRERMFRLFLDEPIKTWNPLVGCLHDCYHGRCWARIQARRQKRRCLRCYDFQPHIHRERLGKFPKSGVVFVVSMGDMWGSWVPDEWIRSVLLSLKPCWEKPDLTFFFETKNPARYVDFVDLIPPNSILSTTIESNFDHKVSKAPPPKERYLAMVRPELEEFAKHVSIEPIMKFDLKTLYRWIQEINPKMISIGYDNYYAGLPEPTTEEVRELIDKLKRITVVEVKKDRRGLHQHIK
ncbi:MAG: DUF5131 family protein [Deltaproteobacteria bacterium]|nr:DUF5131 family protein [Deltaproteobacteria bacterium]